MKSIFYKAATAALSRGRRFEVYTRETDYPKVIIIFFCPIKYKMVCESFFK